MATIELTSEQQTSCGFCGAARETPLASPNSPASVRSPLHRAAYSCTSDDLGPHLAVARDDAAAGGVSNGGSRGCSQQASGVARLVDSSSVDDGKSQRDGSGDVCVADYRNRGHDAGLFRNWLRRVCRCDEQLDLWTDIHRCESV